MSEQAPGASASKAEWAAYLAELGRATGAFKVFPCRPDDGARDAQGNLMCKRPRYKGWQEAASWDRKTVQTMWIDRGDSNIGLAIQRGFVVLDADIYKAGNEALLAEFEAEYGALPETMEFRSASGGKHLIYSTPRMLGNSIGALPKFGDVRGYGGLIVGPGSTAEGKPYTIVDADPPVALPKHVDDRLVERRERTGADRELPPGVTLNDPTNIARYTIWLREKALTGDEDDHQNDKLAAAAAMGSSYGLSEDETVRLLEEHFNPRVAEPWDADRLEYHGGSGYRSANSKFGNMCEPKLFTAVGAATGAAPAGVFRRVSDIASVPAPPRRWALGTDADGWMPENDLTIEYGPGGAGKSIKAAQMCRDISRGVPLFGQVPCQRMPALFIGCEDGYDEMHRRFHKLGVRDTDDITYACLVGQETALHPSFKPGAAAEDTPAYSLISHQLAAMPSGPKFMAMDNLAHFFHGNYFEPSDISRFLGYLRRWEQQFHVTILLLAHPSESQKSSGTGSYGGIGWSAGVRSRLYFERHMSKSKVGNVVVTAPIGDERVFSRKKSNYTREHADGDGLVLDWQDWNFVLVSKPDRAVKLFKPVEPSAPRQSASEAAVLPIVQAAVEEVLAGNTLMTHSAVSLAEKTSALLGEKGHSLVPDTIRKNYLPKLIAASHPGFDRTAKVGRWRHVTTH